MNKSIQITTHRPPQECYIEPSPCNDGMYIVYETERRSKDIDDRWHYDLHYLGYTSVYGLADFLDWECWGGKIC